jgi:hypothetical protein
MRQDIRAGKTQAIKGTIILDRMHKGRQNRLMGRLPLVHQSRRSIRN